MGMLATGHVQNITSDSAYSSRYHDLKTEHALQRSAASQLCAHHLDSMVTRDERLSSNRTTLHNAYRSVLSELVAK